MCYRGDVLPRCHAVGPLEMLVEGTLIVEPDGERDIRHWATFSQETARHLETDLCQVGMRWKADRFVETPYELERRQAAQAREVVQSEIVTIMFKHEFVHQLNDGLILWGVFRLSYRCGMALKQA